MARSKEVCRRSTGGYAPRKKLSSVPARKSVPAIGKIRKNPLLIQSGSEDLVHQNSDRFEKVIEETKSCSRFNVIQSLELRANLVLRDKLLRENVVAQRRNLQTISSLTNWCEKLKAENTRLRAPCMIYDSERLITEAWKFSLQKAEKEKAELERILAEKTVALEEDLGRLCRFEERLQTVVDQMSGLADVRREFKKERTGLIEAETQFETLAKSVHKWHDLVVKSLLHAEIKLAISKERITELEQQLESSQDQVKNTLEATANTVYRLWLENGQTFDFSTFGAKGEAHFKE